MKNYSSSSNIYHKNDGDSYLNKGIDFVGMSNQSKEGMDERFSYYKFGNITLNDSGNTKIGGKN